MNHRGTVAAGPNVADVGLAELVSAEAGQQRGEDIAPYARVSEIASGTADYRPTRMAPSRHIFGLAGVDSFARSIWPTRQ